MVPAMTDQATTEDPEKPDGAHTTKITTGTAPDGGISTRLCGSTRIIQNGPSWIRYGSTKMVTTTTTGPGTMATGGIRTTRISSTPIIRIGYRGIRSGLTRTAPTTPSTPGIMANGGTTRTRVGFPQTIQTGLANRSEKR